MAQNWSNQLNTAFSLQLPADVAAWIDEGQWQRRAATEYGLPEWPEQLLDPQSALVWGGQMLPDTLPILGNGCGDVLCLRFRPDGSVAEIIRWLHESGSWTPYGSTLSEAVLLDATIASMECPEPQDADGDCFLFADWAMHSLRREGTLPINFSSEDGLNLESLLNAKVAEAAVRLVLCERHLTSGLLLRCRQTSGQELADKVGVKWNQFSRWLFDTALVPESSKRKLWRAAGMPESDLLRQNWDEAAGQAQRVVELRPDIAWPYAVMGWHLERKGQLEPAIATYFAGLPALGTSGDFTQNWRMVDSPAYPDKFVIERLGELRSHLPETMREDGYVKAILKAPHSAACYENVRRYWLNRAVEAERQGSYDQAYGFYYKAGWDLYCIDDLADVVLAGLARCAESAGWPALLALARRHQSSFERIR